MRNAATGPCAILGGRIVYALCQFALLAAVARLCGTESVGEVVLGLAVAVPTFALFGGQLRLVQATDAEERLPYRSIERVGLIGHVAGLVLFAAIAFCFRQDLAGWTTLLGVGLSRASESWAEIAFGRLQRRRELSAIGISTALKSLVGTGIAALILAMTESVGLAFAASGGVWLASAAWIDRRLARPLGRGRSEPGDDRDLLRRAAPLSTGATLSTFDSQLPRYVVESTLGTATLGLFGVMHYAALALLTFVIPMTYSQTPKLADDVARQDRRSFDRRARRGLVVATALGATLALAGCLTSPILAWAFDEPRLAAGWTFPLLLIAAATLAPAAIVESQLRAMQGFRSLMFLQATSLVVHTAACLAGQRWFGLEGVALGTIVRSVVYLALLSVVVRFAARFAFEPAVDDRETSTDAVKRIAA